MMLVTFCLIRSISSTNAVVKSCKLFLTGTAGFPCTFGLCVLITRMRVVANGYVFGVKMSWSFCKIISGSIFSSAGCCPNPSSNNLGVCLGSGWGVWSESEQVIHSVKMQIKMADPESICSVLHVGVVDEDEEGDSISKDGDAALGVSACSVTTTAKTVIKEKTSLTDHVDSSTTASVSIVQACSPVEDSERLKYEATPDAKKNPTKEVVVDVSEYSSTESEALDGNELGHPACGRLMSVEFPLCTECVQLNLCLQNTLCHRKAHLIKQILRKYGDITRGSILKSIEAKAAFLQLVAEVVERLHSHTLDTIGAHEMQVVQKWTDDAAAVGFHVEWLQHRIKKVFAIYKYRESLTQLNEIKEQIAAAKIALLEMQLQQIILKKEIDSVKDEMDREDLCRSNLSEGLF